MTIGKRVRNTLTPRDSTLLHFPCSNSELVFSSCQRYEVLALQRKKHCPSVADIVSYWAIPGFILDFSGLDACAICSRGIPDAFLEQPLLLV